MQILIGLKPQGKRSPYIEGGGPTGDEPSNIGIGFERYARTGIAAGSTFERIELPETRDDAPVEHNELVVARCLDIPLIRHSKRCRWSAGHPRSAVSTAGFECDDIARRVLIKPLKHIPQIGIGIDAVLTFSP